MSENPDPTLSNADRRIIDLPVETWEFIVELLAPSQPCAPRATLLPLLTISRLFYKITIRLLYRTVFLDLRMTRQRCKRCKTRHGLQRLESLFDQNSNLDRIRNLEIDIDTKTPPKLPWTRVLSLVNLVPTIVSVTIRIDGVVGWDVTQGAHEPITYDVLRRFYQSFQLLNQIKLLQSLECYVSEELWSEYFTSDSRREMSKQIPGSIKELTMNAGLSLSSQVGIIATHPSRLLRLPGRPTNLQRLLCRNVVTNPFPKTTHHARAQFPTAG